MQMTLYGSRLSRCHVVGWLMSSNPGYLRVTQKSSQRAKGLNIKIETIFETGALLLKKEFQMCYVKS